MRLAADGHPLLPETSTTTLGRARRRAGRASAGRPGRPGGQAGAGRAPAEVLDVGDAAEGGGEPQGLEEDAVGPVVEDVLGRPVPLPAPSRRLRVDVLAGAGGRIDDQGGHGRERQAW